VGNRGSDRHWGVAGSVASHCLLLDIDVTIPNSTE
jgi:hypothetical protein